jgi:hypothetical protein
MEKREERVERCGEVRGWCSPFIGVRGGTEEGWPGVNASVNGVDAIEDGEGGGGGLREELRGENEGGVVIARRHTRRGTGRRGVAER